MSELPDDFKKKWCAALRSGEYTQGRGYLAKLLVTNEIAYCCLGVACRVAGIPVNEIMMKGMPSDPTITFPKEIPA